MTSSPANPPTAGASSPLALDMAEERARLAGRTLGDALLLGIVGDALLRVSYWGANMTAWSIAIVLAMVTLARRRSEPLSPDARWLLVPALALSLMFVLRDSEELVAYNTLTLIGTLGLLAAAIEGSRARKLAESRVRDIVQTGVTVGFSTALGMLPLVLSDVSLRQVAHARGASRVITGIRAALVAIPLLLIFGGLFASADPVFARIAGDLLRIDAGTVASHLAVSGIIAWLVGGLLRATVLSSGPDWQRIPFPDGALGLTEVSVALGSLVLLFAAFVVVQLRYFFGGDALVQTTAGMSYADYARRGFFELVAVAALVLPVLLAANALLRRATPLAGRVFRTLASTLLGLLGVIMYSAVARMQLYVSAYGLSADRLVATVFIGWLALVFVWFGLTVLRGRETRFVSGVLVSGWATLIAFNVADPAGYVARFNVARGNAGKTIDVRYIARLGGDAAPALVEYLVRQPLTAPAGWVPPDPSLAVASVAAPAPSTAAATSAAPTEPASFTERCEAARRLLRDWSPASPNDWRSWSVGRAKARRVVAANEGALRKLAGPETDGTRPLGCAAAPQTS
jgi:hypothetical protein